MYLGSQVDVYTRMEFYRPSVRLGKDVEFCILVWRCLFRARTIHLRLPQRMLAGLLELFFELFDPRLTPPVYVSLLRGASRHLCRRHNHLLQAQRPITSSIFKTLEAIIEDFGSHIIWKFYRFQAVVEVLWNKMPKQSVINFVIILRVTFFPP